jgi:hypothetical protein
MSNSGHETEINRAPALRISHIVYGRENTGTRVRYFIDPTGKAGPKEIPENVVLKRWRQRKMENHSFHGCRLSPNLWRAIGRAYGNKGDSISKLTPGALEKNREIIRADAAEHHLMVPNADVLHSIISALGSKKLQQILDRHLDPARTERFGTPDLFLFAKKKSDTGVAFYRFVEVKKPKERVSNDQHEEIAFLRSIGIQARILRLIERN